MVKKDKQRFFNEKEQFSKFGYFDLEDGSRSTEILEKKSKKRVNVETVDS